MAGHAQPGKAPGSRLKPVADSLDTVGFVSKGDQKYAHGLLIPVVERRCGYLRQC